MLSHTSILSFNSHFLDIIIVQYYRDPETGRQFRSLKEVERYISEGITPPTTRVKRLKYLHDAKVENHTTEGVTPTRTRGKRVNYLQIEKVRSMSMLFDLRYTVDSQTCVQFFLNFS